MKFGASPLKLSRFDDVATTETARGVSLVLGILMSMAFTGRNFQAPLLIPFCKLLHG